MGAKSKVLAPIPKSESGAVKNTTEQVTNKTIDIATLREDYGRKMDSVIEQSKTVNENSSLNDRRTYIAGVFSAMMTGKQLSDETKSAVLIPDINPDGKVIVGRYQDGVTVPTDYAVESLKKKDKSETKDVSADRNARKRALDLKFGDIVQQDNAGYDDFEKG